MWQSDGLQPILFDWGPLREESWHFSPLPQALELSVFPPSAPAQVLICRNYRGDVDMSEVEHFMPILMEKEEEGMLSPILAHGGVRFMWIKHNNLYCIPLQESPWGTPLWACKRAHVCSRIQLRAAGTCPGPAQSAQAQPSCSSLLPGEMGREHPMTRVMGVRKRGGVMGPHLIWGSRKTSLRR